MEALKQEVKAVDVAKAFPTSSEVKTPKAAEKPPLDGESAKSVKQKEKIAGQISKFYPVTQPTAEERIGRIEHFKALSMRFKLLKEKANDLKMFDAGNDRTNAKIILRNGADFEFSVSNSNVIKKVRDAMEKELNILLMEAENEVLNFEI